MLKDQFIAEIEFIVRNRTYQKYIKKFRKYLWISRLSFVNRNCRLLLRLQLRFANILSRIGKQISQTKKQLANPTTNVAQLKTQLAILMQLERAIRQIGDGIAWRNLKFDRHSLRILSEGQKSGFSLGDPGKYQEMIEAINIVSKNKTRVLICDLTNFLRNGDLIEIKDRTYEIHEIKGSERAARGGRKIRQRERLNNILELLNTKVVERQNGFVRTYDIFVKTYLADVKRIIKKARGTGLETYLVAPHLKITCIYFPKIMKRGDPKDFVIKQSASVFPKEHIVIPFYSWLSFITELGEFARIVVPYSVFPLPTRDCNDLIGGQILLIAHLSLNEVCNHFKKSGWQVFIEQLENVPRIDASKIIEMHTHKDPLKSTFEFDPIKVKKDEVEVAVPMWLIIRMGMEFLTIETVGEFIEKFSASTREASGKKAKPSGEYIVFEREKDIWV